MTPLSGFAQGDGCVPQTFARTVGRLGTVVGLRPTRPPSAPKDASAACVVASALLELSGYVDVEKGRQYREAAENMLSSLSRNYQSGERCVSFLLHSTGHHPAGSEIDASIIYADYYYYEALLRLRRLQQGRPVLGIG